MELRSLLLLVAGAPAVLGFQAAMRVGAMKPAMAVRASTAMLVDPAMLDAAAIVDAPMQLLALKSEADEVIDELFGLVYPVGTAIGLGVRRRPPPFSGVCASRRPDSTGRVGQGSLHWACHGRAAPGGRRTPEAQAHISAAHTRPGASHVSRRLLPVGILFRTPSPLRLHLTYPPTYHAQLIVKGLVDDQLKSSRLSQLIFLAVGGFFTFIFLALALP